MANTRRETTAPSSENTTESAGSGPIPVLGFGPHHSTAADVTCQGFSQLNLPIGESVISCIARAVDTAYTLHNRTNGSTVSFIDGNMAGRKLFSVSIYPTRKRVLGERPTRQELLDFALANEALLREPAHALSTLFDDWHLVHVLEVVLLVPDRDTAAALSYRHGQIIFDLESCREISVRCPPQTPSDAGGADA